MRSRQPCHWQDGEGIVQLTLPEFGVTGPDFIASSSKISMLKQTNKKKTNNVCFLIDSCVMKLDVFSSFFVFTSN